MAGDERVSAEKNFGKGITYWAGCLTIATVPIELKTKTILIMKTQIESTNA